MITLRDARGQRITLQKPPRRIVSLVPSQSELLYSLGLDSEVVGITRFCVHPPAWTDSKRIVGGTKLLRIDRIRDLKPDLIFANLEENTKEDVERVEDVAPVFVTNVRTLDEAVDMIESLALLVDREPAGTRVTSAIREAFDSLVDELGIDLKARRADVHPENRRAPGSLSKSSAARRVSADSDPIRTAYLIWRDPFMSVGSDTFIHDMMRYGGLENVFGSSMRYPRISTRDLIDADPDVVLLSSEPFPFVEKHLPEIEQLLPAARVHLVDGQLFSWYGSRLIHTPDYLRQLRRDIGVDS